MFNILDSYETIQYIIDHKVSISRYGDGEFAMIYHLLNGGDCSNFYIKAFQDYDENLAMRLKDILLNSNVKNHKIGVPYAIIKTDEYVGMEKVFWERFVVLDISRFTKILDVNRLYLNSCFTRFYMGHKHKNVDSYVYKLKKIWDRMNICIVEGEESRLGVGNDLFENAASIRRILCPSLNAFSKYDEIFNIIKEYSKFDLYLLALGHTATILAYDLSQIGLWAIDIGHVDIEYEWYLMGAKEKKRIKTKYVNEIPEGRIVEDIEDPVYKSQIIMIV